LILENRPRYRSRLRTSDIGLSQSRDLSRRTRISRLARCGSEAVPRGTISAFCYPVFRESDRFRSLRPPAFRRERHPSQFVARVNRFFSGASFRLSVPERRPVATGGAIYSPAGKRQRLFFALRVVFSNLLRRHVFPL
jgi:hypothetical protein